MNLLTLKKGNKRYDLQINNIKYCIGNDFEEKYNFVNILKEVFLLSKESEYSINNSGQAQVLINDKEIKVKEISFYQINHHYSITNDLKLTAHSLIARYIELLIAQDDNIDTINTINLLLESFTNELDNELIYPKFITYTPKQFLKILLPIFLKEEDQANELIKKYKLENVIKKYPMQTQKELALFYSAIDIFCFPTYRKSDSLGLVGLEAMACGCIVIASNMAGPTSYIKDQENGFFFKPRDGKDLNQKIEDILSMNEHQIKEIKDHAYQTAKAYDVNDISQNLVDIFNGI